MIDNPSTINPLIIQTYRGVFFYPFILRECYIRAIERKSIAKDTLAKLQALI